MPLRVEVELDAFSGRPNPSWRLAESDAAVLVRMLPDPLPGAVPGNLGYRGFVVYIWAEDGSERTVRVHNAPALERWLLDSGRGALEENVYLQIVGQLGR